MKKSVFKILLVFIIGMIGGIFAEQIFWPYFVERPLFYQYKLERAPVYLTETREIYIEENTVLKDSFEKVKNSIVRIQSTSLRGAINGSGLIVTNDGLMVTLAELVPQGYGFSFFVNGENVRYQILKRDLNLNLALIKLDEGNFSTLGFKSKEAINKGERVFLSGYSLFDKSYEKTINEGIIKNIGEKYIYTNIAEKSGLKGSVLFNIQGEIIGINLIGKDGEIYTISSNIIREFAGF